MRNEARERRVRGSALATRNSLRVDPQSPIRAIGLSLLFLSLPQDIESQRICDGHCRFPPCVKAPLALLSFLGP